MKITKYLLTILSLVLISCIGDVSNENNTEDAGTVNIAEIDANLPPNHVETGNPPTNYSPMAYGNWQVVEQATDSGIAVLPNPGANLIHMTKVNTDGKIYYKRTALDGLTTIVNWTLVPGQTGTQTFILPTLSYNPANLNQVRIWRIKYGTNQIEYMTYLYNINTHSWIWGTNWTLMSCLGTTDKKIGISYPSGGNNLFVFTRGIGNQHIYGTYMDANTTPTNCVFSDMGGLTERAIASVYVKASGSSDYPGLHVFAIGLDNTIYRNRNTGTSSPTMINWSGWQQISGPYVGYQASNMTTMQIKNCNYCLQYRDSSNGNLYEECTLDGNCTQVPSVYDEPITFGNWIQIYTPNQNTSTIEAFAYCGNSLAPYYCYNLTEYKYFYARINGGISLIKDVI